MKPVSRVGTATREGAQHVQELEAGGLLRVHVQMVEADRHADDQQHDEGDARHLVAEQTATGDLGQDGVHRDVRREQPEIDDRMQGPGEQGARQARVDGVHQAERPGDQLEQHLDADTGAGPQPHDGIGRGAVHRQRYDLAGVVTLPGDRRHDHFQAPDPRTDHQQGGADVEHRVGHERWIEGVEYRCLAGQQRDGRHDRAAERDEESDPGQPSAPEWALQGRGGRVVTETHDEEGGEHEAHQHAVGGDRREVQFVRFDLREQAAAVHDLVQAKNDSDEECGERDPEIRDH